MPRYIEELTVILRNGTKVTAEVEIRTEIDNNYGADADGNRGGRMEFIEDIIIPKPLMCSETGRLLTDSECEIVEQLLISAAENCDLQNEVE